MAPLPDDEDDQTPAPGSLFDPATLAAIAAGTDPQTKLLKAQEDAAGFNPDYNPGLNARVAAATAPADPSGAELLYKTAGPVQRGMDALAKMVDPGVTGEAPTVDKTDPNAILDIDPVGAFRAMLARAISGGTAAYGNPLGLATAVTGAGEAAPLVDELPRAAELALRGAQVATGGAQAVQGASEAADPTETTTGRITGGVQSALGALAAVLGLRGFADLPPERTSTTPPSTPAKPSPTTAPFGRDRDVSSFGEVPGTAKVTQPLTVAPRMPRPVPSSSIPALDDLPASGSEPSYPASLNTAPVPNAAGEAPATDMTPRAVPADITPPAPVTEEPGYPASLNRQTGPGTPTGPATGDTTAPDLVALNGSGDSAASLEAINRNAGMQARGEQFVKYDRTGQRTPLIGVDAVDYHVQPGETYGVESPNGFQVLDDNGGNVPAVAQLPAELRDAIAPDLFHGHNELPSTPAEPYDLGGADTIRFGGRSDFETAVELLRRQYGDEAADQLTNSAFDRIGAEQDRFLAEGRTDAERARAERMYQNYYRDKFPGQIGIKSVGSASTLPPGVEGGGTAPPNIPHTADGLVIPPEAQTLHASLQPAWAERGALEDQGLFGGPYQSNKGNESLNEFVTRIATSDPRQLMGPERVIRQLLDAGGDETGAVDPWLALHLASGGAGALIGAKDQPEHPIVGGLLGAAAGVGASYLPELALHPESTAAKAAQAVRYGNMLLSPATIGRKILGDITGAGSAMLDNPAQAGAIRRNFFSRQTLKDAINNIRSGQSTSTTPYSGTQMAVEPGLLGLPHRIYGGITDAAKAAYKRAGLSDDQAALYTYSNDPTTAAGKAYVSGVNKLGVLGDLALPFTRTATSIAEQGTQALPGGAFAALLAKAGRGEDILPSDLVAAGIKQIPAAVAAGVGVHNADREEQTGRPTAGSIGSRFGTAAGGRYGLTYDLAKAFEKDRLAQAKSKTLVGSPALNAAKNLPKDYLEAINPFSTDMLDPGQVISQGVPSALGDVSRVLGVDPRSLNTNSVLGPAISEIPGLNKYMLKPSTSYKPPPARGTRAPLPFETSNLDRAFGVTPDTNTLDHAFGIR